MVPPQVVWKAEELSEAWESWDGRPGTFRVPSGVGRRLGEGNSRVVYQIGDFAVKIPRSSEDGDAAFNQLEGEAWGLASRRLRQYLLPVLNVDPNGGRWLIMPIAEPVTREEAEGFCRKLEAAMAVQVARGLYLDCEERANVARYNGKLVLLDYPFDLRWAGSR
jgi:hypothetical protein